MSAALSYASTLNLRCEPNETFSKNSVRERARRLALRSCKGRVLQVRDSLLGFMDNSLSSRGDHTNMYHLKSKMSILAHVTNDTCGDALTSDLQMKVIHLMHKLSNTLLRMVTKGVRKGNPVPSETLNDAAL